MCENKIIIMFRFPLQVLDRAKGFSSNLSKVTPSQKNEVVSVKKLNLDTK